MAMSRSLHQSVSAPPHLTQSLSRYPDYTRGYLRRSSVVAEPTVCPTSRPPSPARPVLSGTPRYRPTRFLRDVRYGRTVCCSARATRCPVLTWHAMC
eukprot:1838089-Rhodomonas_salina.1